MDTYAVNVDIVMTAGKLLNGGALIGQTIVAQIAVAIIVIPLGAVWVAAALTDGDDRS